MPHRRPIAIAIAVTTTLLTAVAPMTAFAADPDTSGPMSALSDFSSLALLAAVLIAWYGAAVTIHRRTPRRTQDR